MSLLSRLFGKSEPKAAEPVVYKDCRIFPAPIKEANGYRIAARIEKDVAGVTKVHQLQRADSFSALDAATEATIGKAKTAIDQLGDSLFA